MVARWSRRLARATSPLLVAATALPARGFVPQEDSTDVRAISAPGETISAVLLTMEPGDALWERFGHNAIVIRDEATGFEAAYNYGIFDFSDADFYRRFMMGTMMYRVQPQSVSSMLSFYRWQNRRVWAQELALDPEDRVRLAALLADAALPENRRYRYQYYLNNCSTKLRDAIDEVLDGALRGATDGPPTGATWREHTRRLTSTHPLGYLGIDLVLGPKGDELTNRWDEMWVPMKLRATIGETFLTRSDGSEVPLVLSEELWVDSDRPPEPEAAPVWMQFFLLAGSAGGLVVVLLGRACAAGSTLARIALSGVAVLWGTLCTVVGLVLIAIHWTDHEFMYWNRNALLFNPLAAAVAVAVARSAWRGRASRWGQGVAYAALGASVLAVFLCLLAERTGSWDMIALVLPMHAALWWVARGRSATSGPRAIPRETAHVAP